MKLKSIFISVLLFTTSLAVANEKIVEKERPSFHFSTKVSRVVERDLMSVELFNRKSGKKLSELKQQVAKNLNKVLELAKQYKDIEIFADGVSNYADYDQKNNMIGWIAEGRIRLMSKNFDAVAEILDSLDDNIAVASVNFSVSPETLASLEDEMTVEIIKQFQHKAEIIKESLNAQNYSLSEIHLNTPTDNGVTEMRAYSVMAAKSAVVDSAMPLESGKQRVMATATGKVVFD